MKTAEAAPGGQPAAPTIGRHRQYTGVAAKLFTAFSAAIILYALLYVAGILGRLGIHVYGGVHRSVILTAIVAMVFILVPATKTASRNKLPWYDIVLLLLSVVAGGYLVLNIYRIDRAGLPANILQQVLALTMVALVLEAVRRTVSWIFTVLGILFFAYPFYSQFLPGIVHGSAYSLQRVTTMVYLDSSRGINGDLMHLVAVVILVFVSFGAFFQSSGAGKFFIDISLGLLGRYRGGPAKVSVLASGFLGMIVSSGVANVVTTGVVTIPLMKGIGFKPHFAAAVETAASIGGHFTPPVMAVTAFIIADILGITYLSVCIAAFIPSLLYYLALLIMVDLEAARAGLRGLPPNEIPSLRRTMAEGWFYLVPVAVLLFFLVVLHYDASTAAIYAVGTVVLVSFLGKKENRMWPGKLVLALSGAGRGLLEVGSAIAVAGMLVSSMALTGVGIRITGSLVELAGGSQLILLLLVLAITIVMGMVLTPTAVFLTVAILVAPAMIASGIQPIGAYLFVLFFATAALITPPVCLPAYVAASIAGSNFMLTGFTAMRLGLVAFLVPVIFVYSPELLMIGLPEQVALAVLTALIGIYLLSAGLQGYLLRAMGFLPRSLLLAAGVLMIIPGWTTDVIGAATGAVIVLWQTRETLSLRLRTSNRRG